MDTSRIRINNLREAISNLEYLVEVSTNRSSTGEYNTQLDILRERLAAVIVAVPRQHISEN
jgi:predicted glycosyltransferase